MVLLEVITPQLMFDLEAGGSAFGGHATGLGVVHFPTMGSLLCPFNRKNVEDWV